MRLMEQQWRTAGEAKSGGTCACKTVTVAAGTLLAVFVDVCPIGAAAQAAPFVVVADGAAQTAALVEAGSAWCHTWGTSS